jgi:hypothetical protein
MGLRRNPCRLEVVGTHDPQKGKDAEDNQRPRNEPDLKFVHSFISILVGQLVDLKLRPGPIP